MTLKPATLFVSIERVDTTILCDWSFGKEIALSLVGVLNSASFHNVSGSPIMDMGYIGFVTTDMFYVPAVRQVLFFNNHLGFYQYMQ